MKKLLSCFLTLALVLSFSSTYAYANETTTFQISELEFMQYLLSLSDQELLDKGCTNEELEYFRNHDFNQDLLDFAQKVQLQSGYSEQDKKILKSYNGAIDAFDYLEATPFAGATLTFTLSKSSMDSSLVKLSYSAVWSSCPIWTATDIIALTWRVSDSNSYPLNSTTIVDELEVMYYLDGNKNDLLYHDFPSNQSDNFDSCYYNIEMGQTTTGEYAVALASYGFLWILPSSGSSNMHTLEIMTAYGHSQLFTTPSVSFSESGVSLGISFSWYVNTEHKDTYIYRVDE